MRQLLETIQPLAMTPTNRRGRPLHSFDTSRPNGECDSFSVAGSVNKRPVVVFFRLLFVTSVSALFVASDCVCKIAAAVGKGLF